MVPASGPGRHGLDVPAAGRPVWHGLTSAFRVATMSAMTKRWKLSTRRAALAGAGPSAVRTSGIAALVALVLSVAEPAAAQPARPDLLTFAAGAIPLRIEADAAARVGMEHAIAAIDGAPDVRSITSAVPSDTRVAFVYVLPAPTVFERLAVPRVLETPSPSQTFVREVTVYGSARSATDGFVQLASGTLKAHAGQGEQTELTLHRRDAVRWVRVELAGGLHTPRSKVFLEFSEIIGEGRQESAPVADHFGGPWTGRGLALTLKQQGAVVSGCYDRSGRLEGTVDGPVLQATGRDPKTGVPSGFIAARLGDGRLQVLRSTNGAPFKLFSGERGDPRPLPQCDAPATPVLGCGAVIHGIRFDFDAATLRPGSAPLLDALQRGLAADASREVLIEGHTSSEGAEDYNRALSDRRARAVVDALVQRGIAATRLRAAGLGEARPIAPNDDEAGRALNRRVEVRCRA